MDYTTIVRFDEIALKTPHIRQQFVLQLATNIKEALRSWNAPYKEIRNEWDMLFIDVASFTQAVAVANVLTKVFGVHSVSPAVYCPYETQNKLVHQLVEYAKGTIFPNDLYRFKIKIKDVNDFNRGEFVERVLKRLKKEISGTRHVSAGYSRELYLYLRESQAYFFHFKQPGPGGFPLGTNGKAACLISGGIDSPVAAWLLMKRGMIPIFVHCATTAMESPEQPPEDVSTHIRTIIDNWGYGKHTIKSYIVPFGRILAAFKDQAIDIKYTCIFCKRMMYRIAEQIALTENAQAIITGENLGQVASQTAWNLRVIDKASSLPIYRPLIAFNKLETITIARNIGTFTNQPSPENCYALPDQIVIKAEEEVIEQAEKKLNIPRLVDDAIKHCKLVELTPP